MRCKRTVPLTTDVYMGERQEKKIFNDKENPNLKAHLLYKTK